MIFDILAVSPYLRAKNQKRKASPLGNTPSHNNPKNSAEEISIMSENNRVAINA